MQNDDSTSNEHGARAPKSPSPGPRSTDKPVTVIGGIDDIHDIDQDALTELLAALDADLELKDLQFRDDSWNNVKAVVARNKRKLDPRKTPDLSLVYALLVAVDNGKYVGFLAGRPLGNTAVIAILGRLSSAERTGVGPALFNNFVDLARANGATRLKAMLDTEPKGRALREKRSKIAGLNEVEGDPYIYMDLTPSEDQGGNGKES